MIWAHTQDETWHSSLNHIFLIRSLCNVSADHYPSTLATLPGPHTSARFPFLPLSLVPSIPSTCPARQDASSSLHGSKSEVFGFFFLHKGDHGVPFFSALPQRCIIIIINPKSYSSHRRLCDRARVPSQHNFYPALIHSHPDILVPIALCRTHRVCSFSL